MDIYLVSSDKQFREIIFINLTKASGQLGQRKILKIDLLLLADFGSVTV